MGVKSRGVGVRVIAEGRLHRLTQVPHLFSCCSWAACSGPATCEAYEEVRHGRREEGKEDGGGREEGGDGGAR